MKHHLLTAAILLLALVLYGVGMTRGSLAVFSVGMVLELWFWMRVVRRGRDAGPVLPAAKR
jgi:hypothetical protein